jgi:XTP/dITP diphosphohydrolase
MEFLLASSNLHKANEFNELTTKLGGENNLKIVSAPLKLEVVENGTSYFENAHLKAKAYYDKFKKPVLADDSGVNVLSLPDDLGIHSARFGGDGLNDKDRALLLLDKLNTEESLDRSAYFTCVLCFYLSPSEIFYFEGRMFGKIAYNYRGTGGFGYDPVFIPRDCPNNDQELTISELTDWKNENSHRATALKSALQFFREK